MVSLNWNSKWFEFIDAYGGCPPCLWIIFCPIRERQEEDSNISHFIIKHGFN